MQSISNRVLIVLVVGLGMVAGGCGSNGSGSSGKSSQPSGGSPQNPAASRQTDAGGAKPEGLAELSEADRVLAEKQRICPVTGEPLGGMGKPYKTTVKGKTVFLCCDGCEEELKKDPDKYLAKLAAAEKK